MKKKIIKLVKIAIATIVSVLILMILFLVLRVGAASVYNNAKTKAFYTSLKNINFPSGSRVIDGYKKFGHIWGESNHCDAEVAVVISTKMNSKDLDNFLSKNLNQIDYPYGGIPENYDLFVLRENNEIAFVSNGREYEIKKSQFGYYADEYEFGSDRYKILSWELGRDFDRILSLASKIKIERGFNYFIVLSADQSFDYFPMNDFRCH
ncbi:MAG: hypothetical protein BWY43_00308 [candidate division WS2 bacterium ADurb.Bin280]|uniref:Uncharacterized protein n=1 Tax=candidate division WS2 bacterium ADurb.Bin280 TaxID=1852829 RepID=A0A1V5SEH4_9BACT|nr:MAG: hypothetical protein BWY43_00308 [candidate division WS2 bacterium ADurb.Bin280]